MRAVRFHKPGDLRVEEIPLPAAPGPGQVLLTVKAAGICGSDLHNYRTGMWIAHLPVTPGHEFAGEVLAVGAGVTGLEPGDLAVADSRVTCGVCANCLAGRANLCGKLGFVGEVCDGGFAEQVVLPASGLLKAPAGLAPEIAAMAEPLAVALHAMRRLDPAPGAPILVTGGGTIGGLTALLLAEHGFGPILLAERNAARASLLREVVGVQPVPLDHDAVRDACGGNGPRFCLDATGSLDVLRFLLRATAPGGRLAMVGIFHGEGTLDPNLIVERELDLRGCAVYAGEQAEALALLPRLAGKLAQLAETPIGLAEVPDAYERLISGGSDRLKTLIVP
ncbi:zinc-dependent alcohol dehydrogenase [Acidisoma silvae]|uniref:Alcohol dehydrogenase catalytic domain-containing protein n=1 Tax=Acidisoma silvae TaxID=2802396 RepID=A0A963YRF0_9PROT|nr:alcohol dehydrogenase catalytic domain-containing protein [Acidisoma silvae]MCB8875542.1 alcohol dehydrogenase catalytic domain-containing protein [Acidisoma silvae]